MKVLVVSLFLAVSFNPAFACVTGEISFPKNDACAAMSWIVGPSVNQFNSLSVHVSGTQLKLNVVPWMVMDGGHEHGSRPVVVSSPAPSEYLVEKIYFMGGMVGDWFLKLQLLDADKKIIEEVRVKVAL